MKLLKFSENLRIALAENEMTQKELAEFLGTTQQTVSRWLQEINEPDLATLLEICLHLGISPNEILGYDDISEQEFMAYCQDPETDNKQMDRLITALHEEDYDDNDETD